MAKQLALSPPERQPLKLLAEYGPGIGLKLPEGKMADCGADLVKRGLVEEFFGFYAVTDAGRSQLRSNL